MKITIHNRLSKNIYNIEDQELIQEDINYRNSWFNIQFNEAEC